MLRMCWVCNCFSAKKLIINNLLLFFFYCILGSVIVYTDAHFFSRIVKILGFIISSCSPSEEAPHVTQYSECAVRHITYCTNLNENFCQMKMLK